MSKPVYVLGTGLSHDGASCLLKDGKIVVAIEKERINRVKHDGGNDLLTVQYCLDAAGITAADLSLVVQAANFEKETIDRDNYRGVRGFAGYSGAVISISHHLSHAWSAAAVAPFADCGVLVIDGCGSPYQQCDDLQGALYGNDQNETYMVCEKDSFYHFHNNDIAPVLKDFSKIKFDTGALRMPNIEHSIGGMYSAASNYCFGNMDDAGKLMGLAPYGKDTGKPPIFRLEEGRCFVDKAGFDEVFTNPRFSYEQFKEDFQHYADIAWWVQQETTRAVIYLVQHRMQLIGNDRPLALAGGVALNAVANAALLQRKVVGDLFIQPAAGDNGLALGCAYYGWMKLLGNEKPAPLSGVFFGRQYPADALRLAVERHHSAGGCTLHITQPEDIAEEAARALAEGKIIGWFRGGAEFGPRALGHRSVLADPRLPDIQLRINRDIKNREDFRPFAPSVTKEHAADYFVHAYDSPYMILTDQIKDEWKDILKGVVHVDGSCRVQTVVSANDPVYHKLISSFGDMTGIYVLLNTSFNVRGMPIVETPAEAIAMYAQTALDELYIDNYKIIKQVGTV